MSAQEGNAALDPAFFDGRLLVEILTWDWHFGVRVSDEGFPAEYRFQGGLHYTRGFEIEGRIAAPSSDVDRAIRLWLSPFGPDRTFDVDSPDGVGDIHRHEPPKYGRDLGGTLLIPESAVTPIASCLSSVWKYLHIWTFDEDPKGASVSAFSFSRDVHKNLAPWIAGGAE